MCDSMNHASHEEVDKTRLFTLTIFNDTAVCFCCTKPFSPRETRKSIAANHSNADGVKTTYLAEACVNCYDTKNFSGFNTATEQLHRGDII